MKRIKVEVRDVKSFTDCKPLQLRFTIEGADEDLKVVLASLRVKYPEPQYGTELISEWRGYHLLNPDLSIMKAAPDF
jgi:hypothetical protein